MQNLTQLVSVVTQLSTLVGVVITGYKIYDWAKKKDKHDRENYLATLRLTIMSTEMPLSERISAGDKYIALGGNGAVKHKYEELLEQLPKERRN